MDFLHNTLEGNSTPYNYTDSSFEYLFSRFNINSLIKLKWFMSFSFSLFFYSVGLLFAKVFFGEIYFKKFLKTQTFGLISLMLLSIGFYFLSTLQAGENSYVSYYISLEFSHFLQSTLFPIVFLIVFYAYTSINTST